MFGGTHEARKMTERGSIAIKEAGFGSLSIHDARHTYASLMIAAGVNAKALSEFMGRATIAITFDLYSHMLPAARRSGRCGRVPGTLGGTGADPSAPRMHRTLRKASRRAA